METQFAGVLTEGTRLQEYAIDRVLGRPGGFGITYLATDTHLGKHVAIKEFLPANLVVRSENASVTVRTSDDRLVFDWGLKSFLNEARVLARFNHPNLVQVYRFFEANGTAYIVMEYIEGETLSDLLKREGTLDEQRVQGILMPILDGLAAVHEASILHRDVKPENIIIRPNGQPVLIDFGSARNELGSKTLDVTSILTPGYSPIEQYSAESTNQGPWTDVYALGAVAYRMISGKRPPDAVDRVTSDRLVPAVQEGFRKYSPNFLAAIDWALSVDPEIRPRSVTDWKESLLETLDDYMVDDAEEEPITAAPEIAQRPAPVAAAPIVDEPRSQRVESPAPTRMWLYWIPMAIVLCVVAFVIFGHPSSAPRSTPTVNALPAPAPQPASLETPAAVPSPPPAPVADPQIQALIGKLTGDWSSTREFLATTPGTLCVVQVKRSWTFTFTGASADGASVVGNYATTVEASGGGTRKGCDKFTSSAHVGGDVVAQPQSDTKGVKVEMIGAKCSGDCNAIPGVFDPNLITHEVKLAPNRSFETLRFTDNDIEFALKRSRTPRTQ
ncbi:MAG TPA: serine/threonine-protein kinase [Nevskiaceae bacterium]|nr:serine/threonine-protein kinase [Nevskiaceae bacterium]